MKTMERTWLLKRDELRDVYAAKDTDGSWVVVKVYDGYSAITPFAMTEEHAKRHAEFLKTESRPARPKAGERKRK